LASVSSRGAEVPVDRDRADPRRVDFFNTTARLAAAAFHHSSGSWVIWPSC